MVNITDFEIIFPILDFFSSTDLPHVSLMLSGLSCSIFNLDRLAYADLKKSFLQVFKYLCLHLFLRFRGHVH